MKKILSIVGAVAALLLLISTCSNNTEDKYCADCGTEVVQGDGDLCQECSAVVDGDSFSPDDQLAGVTTTTEEITTTEKATTTKATATTTKKSTTTTTKTTTTTTKKTTTTTTTKKQTITVYVSRTGKIHRIRNCSGMKYYTAMDYEDAVDAGYSHCQNCY